MEVYHAMKTIKSILLSPWLALFTFGILLWVKLSDPYMVESTRLKFYDYLMLGSPKQSEQIVTVNIGEKAIAKYGQWPFPREVHAKIINDLYGRGAAVVGSTILMPESDRMGTDRVLADTLNQYPVVLSQTVSSDCTAGSTAGQGSSQAQSLACNCATHRRCSQGMG